MTSYVVNSGQVLTGLRLGVKDNLSVATGGRIVRTINSGGVDSLDGGDAAGTTLLAGGLEGVYFGAIASGTVIDSGTQTIFQADARGTVVNSGGLQNLFIASAEDTTVNSGGVVSAVDGNLTGLKVDGGTVHLLANATTKSATITSGGAIELDGGAYQYKSTTFDTPPSATATTIRSGGRLDVNGGVTSNSQIRSGGQEFIADGASHGSVIYSGGMQGVFTTGVASGTIVSAGGEQDVNNGGVADGSIINGGLQYVYQADTHDTVINSGGLQSLFIGGSENATVNGGGVVSAVASDLTGLKIDGGYVDLLPNTTAESATVGNGGTLEVDGGTTSGTFQYKFVTFATAASATSTTVQSGGVLDVKGGVTSNSQIRNGGLEAVFLSGSDPASDTGATRGSIIYSGGVEDVHSGAIASGTDVRAGGQLTIETGGFSVATIDSASEIVYGTATSETIVGGGFELLYGIARGAILNNGGTQDDFGNASGTSIYSGGNQLVLGRATGTTVHDGGIQFVERADGDFGVASGTVLTSGGIQTVLGGTSVKTVIGAGATENVSDGTASGSVISGGTLILEEGSSATNGIRFASSGGDLTVDGISQPTTVISGFVATDRIDLHDLGYSGAAVIKLSKTNVLSITGLKGGKVTLTLDPRQSFFGRVFKLASDGSTGTVLTVGNAPPVAKNDSYGVVRDHVLAESAKTGVLANDTDPLRHILSAALVGAPRHGRLALSGDGSFNYTPTPGFIGNDSFTYKAMDGTLASGLATVGLAVTAPAVAKPSGLGSYDLQAAFTKTSGVAALASASAGISLPDPAASGHVGSLAVGAVAADPVPVLSHHSSGLV